MGILRSLVCKPAWCEYGTVGSQLQHALVESVELLRRLDRSGMADEVNVYEDDKAGGADDDATTSTTTTTTGQLLHGSTLRDRTKVAVAALQVFAGRQRALVCVAGCALHPSLSFVLNCALLCVVVTLADGY